MHAESLFAFKVFSSSLIGPTKNDTPKFDEKFKTTPVQNLKQTTNAVTSMGLFVF